MEIPASAGMTCKVRQQNACVLLDNRSSQASKRNDMGAERCRNKLACFYIQGEPVMHLCHDKQTEMVIPAQWPG